MLRNYFKTAWRNLIRNRLFSIVNMAGLSIGIAGCMLIGMYIYHELSFDRFQQNADRLVRATTEYTVSGTKVEVGKTGAMAGPRFAAAFPEIESFVRILNFEPHVVRYGDRTFVEKKLLFADSSFFRIFSFPLLEGDPVSALNGPNKLVITRSMEKKYFGEGHGLGKTMRVSGTTDYLVTGIAADPPANSQVLFDFIASFASIRAARSPDWWHELYATYFLLHASSDGPALEKKIPGFMKEQKDVGFPNGNDYLTYHLEPFARVHLHSRLEGMEPNGNITYVYILASVALLLLCIACVNYTNIATAQSARRIPEIAVRKVMGSGKWQLFGQFIGESLLLNFFAFLIAIFMVAALLPGFNQLAGTTLSTDSLATPASITVILQLYLSVSLVSGAYPAVILSNLKLVRILKAGFSFSGNPAALRRSLIVFQFFISVFLIISTIVILQQMAYVRNKDLGYNQDHVVVMPVDGLMRPKFQSIKEAMQKLPNVLGVTCGAEETTSIHWDDEVSTTTGAGIVPLSVSASPTDIDFVKTMGLHIVAGSDFTLSDWMQLNGDNNPDPHTSYMLNETLAKSLGWSPQEAIGKTIYRSGEKGIVKAVVRDFHFAPLHEPITPLVIFLDSQYYHIYQAFVKISGSNIPSTIKALENTWKERVPHRPFQYHFLDENFNSIYREEQQTAKIFSVFSVLAIVLASLGLFALAAYTTVQRAREIGIRKVLGAGVLQIASLIMADFMKLVLLASLIALPVAWYFMNNWLHSFAYRIHISAWVFLLAFIAAGSIALLSVLFQALKAATQNPVKNLRTE